PGAVDGHGLGIDQLPDGAALAAERCYEDTLRRHRLDAAVVSVGNVERAIRSDAHAVWIPKLTWRCPLRQQITCRRELSQSATVSDVQAVMISDSDAVRKVESTPGRHGLAVRRELLDAVIAGIRHVDIAERVQRETCWQDEFARIRANHAQRAQRFAR